MDILYSLGALLIGAVGIDRTVTWLSRVDHPRYTPRRAAHRAVTYAALTSVALVAGTTGLVVYNL